MKTAATVVAIAALAFGQAAPAIASANDWIRYQEAHDPGYNGRGSDPSEYRDYDRDDDDYYSDYDDDSDRYDRPSSDMRYCGDDVWMPRKHDCPSGDYQLYKTRTKTYVDESGRHFNVFTYIFQYFR
jgi:hypothetical protein